MGAIFLSASVPVVGRGQYHETADPFLIQVAVREFVVAVIADHRLVWGGHPAITPMIWTICEDLAIDYANSVTLYQSLYFQDQFPEENQRFGNVVYVEAVPDDREASLSRMRDAMIARPDLLAGVFIGGMEGVEIEYDLFRTHHPKATRLLVAAPGGAALNLAIASGDFDDAALRNVDFARLYHEELRIVPGADPPLGGMVG